MFPFYDFLIYCFVCAYTPGANNLLSMSNAARFGLRRSLLFNLGITAGFFLVMNICTLFSAALYTLLPRIKLLMQILGAGYMLWLAWKVWKSSGSLKGEKGREMGFADGVILQFMNPKIYIYAITAMSLYILPLYSSPLVLFGFVLVLTVIGASGTYVWALFGAALCRLFARHTRAVNLVMALLLVYCALSLFL